MSRQNCQKITNLQLTNISDFHHTKFLTCGSRHSIMNNFHIKTYFFKRKWQKIGKNYMAEVHFLCNTMYAVSTSWFIHYVLGLVERKFGHLRLWSRTIFLFGHTHAEEQPRRPNEKNQWHRRRHYGEKQCCDANRHAQDSQPSGHKIGLSTDCEHHSAKQRDAGIEHHRSRTHNKT